MRKYKYNWGRFLFVRWFLVSWTLQAVHVLDKSERMFRIILELIPALLLFAIWIIGAYPFWILVLLLCIIHSLFWLLDSTWLVGFREVYKRFKGKGIESVIEFVDWSLDDLNECDNISAITIYGSICRHMYHDRSDFDFRIVQERGCLKTYFKMIKLRIVAIWKYRIPIDLKLVDSVEFLKNEMREDEHPIIPFTKYPTFYNEGDSFRQLKDHPENYLKINQNGRPKY